MSVSVCVCVPFAGATGAVSFVGNDLNAAAATYLILNAFGEQSSVVGRVVGGAQLTFDARNPIRFPTADALEPPKFHRYSIAGQPTHSTTLLL